MNIFREAFRWICNPTASKAPSELPAASALPHPARRGRRISRGKKSLEMLSLYEGAGMRDVWLTPHIMEDITQRDYPFAPSICELPKTISAGLRGRNPADKHLRLHLAAENMLDALFEKRLKANDLLPLGEDGKLLLVETSIFSAPMNFHALLERIKNKGYTPVLAHQRRYLYMERRDYEKLKLMGIKFQRNAFSIDGQYGRKVQKRCKWLMKQDMYDMVGSDMHRLGIFWQYW